MNNMIDVWVDLLNKRYNQSVKSKNIFCWEMTKVFPTLTKEQIFSCLDEPALWERVKAKKDCKKYITKLRADGNVIKIVTATHYSSFKTKIEKCVLRLFPEFTYRDIIICYDKSIIRCDYLIDDYELNLKNSEAKRFLFNAPYNKTADKDSYDRRVFNWKEIYNIITKED